MISGYLISRIVLTDVERGSFSMARFYERRIRRLAPAGIVTIVGTLLIGALWFSPEHLKPGSGRRRDARFGLEFLLLARQPRLFRQGRRSEPRPAFLVAGGRGTVLPGVAGLYPARASVAGKGLPLLILGIGVMSLIGAQMKLGTDPAGAFYLPIFRAYEFAIGALVIFAERWQPRFRALPLPARRCWFWPDRLAHPPF